MLVVFALYLLVGALSGVVAGLFGVGGGVIIVPALVYVFSLQGFDSQILMHLAVGTSLAIICVSSVSSVRTHHRNGFVLWPWVKILSPGLVIGVVLGVYTVHNIPSTTLQIIMGVFLSIVSVQMGFQLMPVARKKEPNSQVLMAFSIFSGWVSALFGIGGGSLNVPMLSYAGCKMQQAVATAAACGMPIAFAGALSNLLADMQQHDLPELSFGYIYGPAFFGIALMSAPFAKLGAEWAKKMSAIMLKRTFAVFLVIIGQIMIFKSLGLF